MGRNWDTHWSWINPNATGEEDEGEGDGKDGEEGEEDEEGEEGVGAGEEAAPEEPEPPEPASGSGGEDVYVDWLRQLKWGKLTDAQV